METWFLNHVLGLSLSVLLLGLPGPLRAETPSHNSTDPAGFRMGNNATSTSYSSESLSPSQRNILLTHTAETHTAGTHTAAANHDTEQTQPFTETSSSSLEAIILSTEPLTSTLVVATTEASSSSTGTSSMSSSSGTGAGTSSSNTGTSSTSSRTGPSTSSMSSSSGNGAGTISMSSSRTGAGTTSSNTGTSSSSSSTSSRTGPGTSSSNTGTSSMSSSSRTGASTSSSNTGTSSSNTGTSSSISGSSSMSSSSRTGPGTSSSNTGTSSMSSSSRTGGGTSSSISGSSSMSSSSRTGPGTGSMSSSSSNTGTGSNSNTDTGTSSRTRAGTSSSISGSSSSSSRTGAGTSSSNTGTESMSGSSSRTRAGTSSSKTSTSSMSTHSSNTGSSTSSGTGSSRAWQDVVNTDQVSDTSPAVFWETSSSMLTEEARLHQDSPDTTLRRGDASSSVSHTAVHTDSTYTSTTISRAGERTLLSVTSSSNNITTSAFTEDNSQQPPSTWGFFGAPETEDYTHSATSTSTDSGDTTDPHMTQSTKRMFSETGSPEGLGWTPSLNKQPNATQHQHTSTSEETSDSTPPLRVTEASTDQSEVSVSSTPPVTSPAEAHTNISGTDQEPGSSVGTSTQSSTGVHSFSTQNQEGTEGLSSQTSEQSVGLGLTTGPPAISSSTSDIDNSLTDTPVLVTDVFLTTTPVTERPRTTEENTYRATPSTTPTITTTTKTTTTTTTSPLPPTSTFRFTTSSAVPASPTEATIRSTPPPTTVSTLALQTSTTPPTDHVPSSQTQGTSTGMVNPTSITFPQMETSTGPLRITTAHGQHTTTTTTTATTTTTTTTTPTTHSTTSRTTETVQTTGKQTDRGTTELMVTTSPTDVKSTKAPPVAPRNPCVSNPCMNGGMCVSDKGHQFTCHCQPAWTGLTCNQDMDECVTDPCPVGSRCVNTRGSFSCECPLGSDLEDGRTCTRAKTFLGTFSVNRRPHDPVVFKSTTVHEIQREIIQLLNASLSVLQGYSRSLLSKKEEDGFHISAVNMFSISTDVTSAEVYNSIQMFLSNCSSSVTHCRMVLHHQLTYHVESLCVAQKTQCDTERSTCTDNSGTAQCQCLPGYYKHNPDDLSCLECGDGYKLENGTCVPCMFGFGGFNCGNFYKLIAVVVSPAGGGLLLILIIALIVTCCKKDKNDINKIIFKSGDLQMSPYADFPKNNRISMEWGRETIEMQENGSTKNLLQMTDIYYSPALRNSDLERNGLYPFTGLPGSRHSCIYPAQWNPSFISDDSRRRDYF